jgi:hypothetical protein
MPPLIPPGGEARRRTIDEARIVDLLLLQGWAFEARGGARSRAEREVRAALDQLVALGLPHGRSAAGERLFDPVETANFLRWAALRLGHPALIERCVPTARRMAREMDPIGPRRYVVTLRRTFNLEGRAPGARVRLRLPLPLEDAGLDAVRIDFIPPDGAPVETAAAPGRLDVLATAPPDGRVTIGLKAAFTAREVTPTASAPSLTPAEAALYTRPSEGLIKVSDRVRALADRLAGVERDPWTVVRRFWRFMLEDLACGSIHYDLLDPMRPLDGVMDRGWYDCRVGSALLAALCRARGIPARLVAGYLLFVAAPDFHTWLEIWIEGSGWRPFDLFSWDLSPAGRDVAWSEHYFGRLDHRMPVERLPRLFGGTGAVRLPAAWQRLVAPDGRGSATEFRALATGALVYREFIEVERLDQ